MQNRQFRKSLLNTDWKGIVTYRDDSDLHPFATKVDAHNGNFFADADESSDYEQG